MSEDEYRLVELQKKNRSYFIEKLEIFGKENFEQENECTEINSLENELLLDALTNLQI